MAFSSSSYGHRLSGALTKSFPQWHQPVDNHECLVPVASSALNVEDAYFEFGMNSNWILSPEALDKFRTALHETMENVEVIFDLKSGGFIIRCSPGDEEEVICLAKRELDDIVTPESSDKPGASKNVSLVTEWRANGGFTPEQLAQYERFTYPHKISHCNYRSTWNLPGSLAREQVSISELLPDNALSELQQLTNTKIHRSRDGSAVYVGAESQASFSVVERKLNTLVRYLILPPSREPRLESFLYGGDNFKPDSGITLHYLSHIDKHLIKTYYLDREDYRSMGSHYKTLFEKGVVARPANTGTMFGVSTAALDQSEAIQPYQAFRTVAWKYKAKEDFSHQEPGNPSAMVDLSSSILEGEARDFRTTQNPLVESWITHLPSFTPQSYESTSNDQKQTMSWPLVDTKAKMGKKEESPQAAPQTVEQENRKPASSRQGSEAPGTDFALDRRYNSPSASRLSVLVDHGNSRVKVDSRDTSSCTSSFITCPQLQENEDGVSESSSTGEVEKQAGETSPKQPNSPHMITSLCSSVEQNMQEPPDTRPTTKKKTHVALKTGGSANDHSRWATNDPFASLWQGARLGDVSNGACKTDQPQLLKNDERDSRSFHGTMKQKASSRHIQNQRLDLVRTLSENLINTMSFLKMFSGLISLKVDLGRFCFTKINPVHIHLPGSAGPPRCHSLEDVQKSLNKRHITSKDVLFTKILTIHGGEANFIVHSKDNTGRERWSNHACRTIYEITCTTTTEANVPSSFIICVDGETFEHTIRQANPESRSLAVHVMEHSWDFRITLASFLDLDKFYKGFAKDLVHRMRIIPQKLGPPVLELTNKNVSQVKIRRVRTRNIASYTLLSHDEDNLSPSSGLDTNILEISEVWDMKGHVESETGEASVTKYERSPGKQQAGEAGIWYEATIQSTMISTALRENRNLEFGDEASWSAEEFQKAGAFDKLIGTALDMVESMDGIGYWGDNFQDALVHGIPPSSLEEVGARTRKRGTSTKSSIRGVSRPEYRAEYW